MKRLTLPVIATAAACLISITAAAESGKVAACEWAPRTGVNVYHSNLEKLTANTIGYLASKAQAGVEVVSAEAADAPAEYFNLNGIRVNPETAVQGLYIVRRGDKVSKTVIR